jgi:hypothetical protein
VTNEARKLKSVARSHVQGAEQFLGNVLQALHDVLQTAEGVLEEGGTVVDELEKLTRMARKGHAFEAAVEAGKCRIKLIYS